MQGVKGLCLVGAVAAAGEARAVGGMSAVGASQEGLGKLGRILPRL